MSDTTNLPKPSGPTTQQKLLAFAILDARNKSDGGLLKGGRAMLTDELVNDYTENGTKTRVLKVGDEKIGTATLNEPSDKVVVSNERALTDWVETHIPDQVEYVTVIREVWLKKTFLSTDRLVEAEDEDGNLVVIDTELGIEVPGVKIQKAGDPTSFSIRLSTEGKAVALQLSDGFDFDVLKAIEAEPMMEAEVVEDVEDAEVVDDAEPGAA